MTEEDPTIYTSYASNNTTCEYIIELDINFIVENEHVPQILSSP